MRIAIQGHPTRGKEVIQILESLGGKNTSGLWGCSKALYHIYKGEICNEHYNPTISKIYTLEEFEKEFPFKVGDKVITNDCSIGIITQLIPEHISSYCVKLNNVYSWCTPSSLRLYKEMNTRNITLTLDKAREWYSKGGELKEIALQAFTKEELNPLPKSWEEYCKGYKVPAMIFGPCIPHKYVALWKLEQLRDCYRQGWQPDWANVNTNKYGIVLNSDKLSISLRGIGVKFLAFQSREVAEEFLKNFEPLIKEAGDLI